MKIFDAYDDTAIRNLFKGYIEAEGVSMSKCEQTYTRFGTYMSRIRGVLFYRMLLEAHDEEDFINKLRYIFHDKWKDHLGYPEIPDYFFRYLDFLHMLCAMFDELEIVGLSDDEGSCIVDGNLSRYENRFLTADNKLRILANPTLIRLLKQNGQWEKPVSDRAIEMCRDYYSGTPLRMTDDDWKSIIERALNVSMGRRKRGAISFEIKDAAGEVRICNFMQTMALIIEMASVEDIARCNVRLNGQPIVTKRIPMGRDASFKDLNNGYYLNNMGTMMDKFKVIRVLISVLRLKLEVSLSKEKAVQSRRKPKKAGAQQPAGVRQPVYERQPAGNADITEDFEYGRDGTLNLFDDF